MERNGFGAGEGDVIMRAWAELTESVAGTG